MKRDEVMLLPAINNVEISASFMRRSSRRIKRAALEQVVISVIEWRHMRLWADINNTMTSRESCTCPSSKPALCLHFFVCLQGLKSAFVNEKVDGRAQGSVKIDKPLLKTYSHNLIMCPETFLKVIQFPRTVKNIESMVQTLTGVFGTVSAVMFRDCFCFCFFMLTIYINFIVIVSSNKHSIHPSIFCHHLFYPQVRRGAGASSKYHRVNMGYTPSIGVLPLN